MKQGTLSDHREMSIRAYPKWIARPLSLSQQLLSAHMNMSTLSSVVYRKCMTEQVGHTWCAFSGTVVVSITIGGIKLWRIRTYLNT